MQMFIDEPLLKKNSFTKSSQDGVVIVDLRPYCISLGIVWPNNCNYFWFVKDGCGVICAVFTWFLILYAQFVVLFVLLLPSPFFKHNVLNFLIFETLVIFAIISHLKTMLSDPGAVPKGNATQENLEKMDLVDGQVLYKCAKCVSIKPERAHHCSVCKRCIQKMDHHCPWVNNCVGQNNQKYFVLFTMYIFMMSLHSLYLTCFYFITCLQSDWTESCMIFSHPSTTILLIFLILEAIMFGLFTLIMCCSQLSSICYDETGIEQLKKGSPQGQKLHWLSSLKQVFGPQPSLFWFSPFHPVFFKSQNIDLFSV